MDKVLEIAKVLVSPIDKLLDMTKAGVGTLYQPTDMKKMCDSKAYEIDKISESLRNNSDVIITYEKGSVIVNSPEFDDFVKRTEQRLRYQELRNQYNIEAVVDNAYAELETEVAVVDEPIDSDWVSRFFGIVKDINSSEMQCLWGKILANEIKQPGSISLRTMDVLKNITSSEANVFQQLLPYIIRVSGDLAIISSDKDIENKFKIVEGHYILLNSCGLLSMIPFTNLNMQIAPNSYLKEFYTKNRLLLINNTTDIERKLNIKDIYLLTPAGKELFDLLASCPDNEYFEEWAKTIYKSNKDLIFTLHESTGEETLKYKEDPLVYLAENP